MQEPDHFRMIEPILDAVTRLETDADFTVSHYNVKF